MGSTNETLLEGWVLKEVEVITSEEMRKMLPEAKRPVSWTDEQWEAFEEEFEEAAKRQVLRWETSHRLWKICLRMYSTFPTAIVCRSNRLAYREGGDGPVAPGSDVAVEWSSDFCDALTSMLCHPVWDRKAWFLVAALQWLAICRTNDPRPPQFLVNCRKDPYLMAMARCRKEAPERSHRELLKAANARMSVDVVASFTKLVLNAICDHVVARNQDNGSIDMSGKVSWCYGISEAYLTDLAEMVGSVSLYGIRIFAPLHTLRSGVWDGVDPEASRSITKNRRWAEPEPREDELEDVQRAIFKARLLEWKVDMLGSDGASDRGRSSSLEAEWPASTAAPVSASLRRPGPKDDRGVISDGDDARDEETREETRGTPEECGLADGAMGMADEGGDGLGPDGAARLSNPQGDVPGGDDSDDEVIFVRMVPVVKPPPTAPAPVQPTRAPSPSERSESEPPSPSPPPSPPKPWELRKRTVKFPSLPPVSPPTPRASLPGQGRAIVPQKRKADEQED